MAEVAVLVCVDLAVSGEQIAIGGDDEGIDLDQVQVFLGERVDDAAKNRAKRPRQSRIQFKRCGHATPHERLVADERDRYEPG